MSLLEKFANVTVEADKRISEEDKAFCLRHQDAFDKAAPVLQAIADLMTSGTEEQQALLAQDYDHFYNPYMSDNDFNCKADDVYDVMRNRNKRFISAIVNYFSRKYSVELDDREVMNHLIPNEPEEPRVTWERYDRLSAEERSAYRAQLEAHKEAVDEYNRKLQTLPLRYEQIVDEIFTQLGGFSFQERAMNELRARCWKSSHRNDWRTGKDVEEFEIKNNTLKLLEAGYWCRCNDDSWRSHPEWVIHQDLKVMLDAIAHFQCGRMGEGYLWFPELFKYDTEENVFEINHMEKIKGIKLFKNGRVDIKFSSAAFAQEFVENYLRRYVEVNAV